MGTNSLKHISTHCKNTTAHHTIIAHPDTGATANYIMKNANIISTPAPIQRVTVPNGEQMVSTRQAQFNIPHVNTTANTARIFDTLKSGNLLSVGQYCDQDCSAHFYKNEM